jgi:hypothetical protein
MQDEVGGKGHLFAGQQCPGQEACVHAHIVYENPLCYAWTACKRGLEHRSHISSRRASGKCTEKHALRKLPSHRCIMA